MTVFSLLMMAAMAAAGPKPVFYASFEGNIDARVAKGDPRLHSAKNYKEAGAPGLGAAAEYVIHAKGEGRKGGDALRFVKRNKAAVYFKAEGNVPFDAKNWTGTVSFWMKVDPETEIERDYCDPLQVTDKAYNDSAIWVDFTKDERPRHFRLGVFGARKEWNPENTNNNPDFDRRLVVVKQPPFSKDRWTNVTITFRALGSGSGFAKLYVDGKPQGETPKVAERFEWDLKKASIRLGVEYTGLMDDVAVYREVLTDKQVAKLAQ